MHGKVTRGRERAEVAFHLYAELGEQRSLRALAQRLDEVGMRIPMGTLRGYSVRYAWQERLRERAAELEQERRRLAVSELRDGVDRRRQIGRGLASFGLSQLNEIRADRERRSRVGVHSTIRAVDVGVRIEREATGDALSMQQLQLALAEEFLPGVARLIRELIVPRDPVLARDLADGIDAELRRAYATLDGAATGTAAVR